MRILILSASTGGGHMRASATLRAYIMKRCPDAVVEIVDTLEYISPLLNKTVTEGYVYFATKTPMVYRAMYNSTNKDKTLNSLVVGFNNLVSKTLLPLFQEFRPDAVITTHPFSTEMVSNLKEQGEVTAPLICLMTDYAPHKTWINPRVDGYVVANDGMVDVMVEMGAKRELIHPYGIPIDSAFFTTKDRASILRGMGLNPEIPTILIMAGSFGVTNILKIYNEIVKIDVEFQIIVITGKNQRLFDAFDRLLERTERALREKPLKMTAKAAQPGAASKTVKVKPPKIKPHKNTKLLYFTNEVDKYMQISDLIITKPGGLTVSEALACNLPMAIFDAIPGQEEENAEFLIDNNMAVRIEKGATCGETIRSLLSNREELEKMKSACRTFDKSDSSENILRLIHQLLDRQKGGGTTD
jgi:processive 1,2-diacylglycerol beta-glucosyltransferase